MPPDDFSISDVEFHTEELDDLRDAIVESMAESLEGRGPNIAYGGQSPIRLEPPDTASYSLTVKERNKYESGLRHNKHKSQMEAPSIEVWFVNEAFSTLPNEQIGEAFANGGVSSVVDLLLDHKSATITRFTETGHDPVSAFNQAARGWPYLPRCFLARYEHENHDRDGEAYSDDVERLASVSTMPELTDQSTLDFFYGSNPIADEDLSTDEAKTLLVLRANGEDDDPEVIDDINDHRAFRACYMECGDQYEALHLHRFDQSVPQEVFTNAAPPEEWPDDMTPAAVPTDHCARCGDRFYRVFGENDEPIWVDEDGEEGGLEQLGFDHSAFFLNRGSPSNYLCSECQEYVKESDTRLALIDEGIHTVATLRSGFGYDRSEENNDYTPADDLPQDIREEFEQTVRSPPSDKYTIEPNDEIGDTSAQHSAIETLIESPEAVDAGPALVYHDGTSGRVWIDYDNSEAAEQVKRAIEHYVNNEPQGLGELFG